LDFDSEDHDAPVADENDANQAPAEALSASGAGDSDAGTPRKSPWKKRIAVAAIVLLVLVGLLPTIVSTSAVTGMILDSARDGSGRWLDLSLSAGWGATAVEDVVVHEGADTDSPVLFSAKEISGLPGLAGVLGGSIQAQQLTLVDPVLRLDLREKDKGGSGKDGGKKKDGNGGSGDDKGEGDPLPAFEVLVTFRNGRLLVVGIDGSDHEVLTFSGTVMASRDAPAVLDLELGSGSGGTLKLEGTVNALRGGRPADTSDIEAAVKATLKAFSLEALEPLLSDAGIDSIAGVVQGSIDATVMGGGLDKSDVVLAVQGLDIAGPAVGEGRRIVEPIAAVETKARATTDGVMELQGLVLKIPGLEVKGDLARTAATGWNGGLELRGALKAWSDRARRWGLETKGAAIGEVNGQVRAVGDAQGQRWETHLKIKDAQFSSGPGSRPVTEPGISIDLEAVQTGDAWRIDAASIESDTVRLSASGTFDPEGDADVKAKGGILLGRTTQVLEAFGVETPGSFTGRLDLDATMKRIDGKGSASGTVTVTDLALTPTDADEPAVKEPKITLEFHALPEEEDWVIEKCALLASKFNAKGSGRVTGDYRGGSFDFSIGADIARLLEMARAFGTELDVDASGLATVGIRGECSDGGQTWTSTAGVSTGGLVVSLPGEDETSARHHLQDVDVRIEAAATGSGAAVDVQSLEVEGAGLKAGGNFSRSEKGVLGGRLKGTLDLGSTFRRLADLGKVPSDPKATGTLSFDTIVSGTQEKPNLAIESLTTEDFVADVSGGGTWFSDGPLDRGWIKEGGKGAAGTIDFRTTVKADGADTPIAFTADGTTKGLQLSSPDGKHRWAPEKFGLDIDGTWDGKTSTVKGTVTALVDEGSVKAEGTADLREGRRTVNAKSDLDLDLSGLAKARPDLMPMEDVAPGRLQGSATLTGTLADPVDWSKLKGSLRASLDSLETKPFTAKEMQVDLLLDEGVLSARQVDAVINEGTVSMKASLGLSGDEPPHHLEVAAKGVQVDRALTTLLERVVPIFSVGDEGSMSGKLSTSLTLDASGVDWKAAKKSMKGNGSLSVDDGVIRNSGIMGQIMSLLGGGDDLEFSNATTKFRVEKRRVWNDNLIIDGEDAPMVLKGSTDFQGRLDYKISAKALNLSKRDRKKFKKLLDKDGNLPFGLKGTLDKPKIKKPNIKDLAGKGVKDKLKDLFD
jgi:hypothetical protein